MGMQFGLSALSGILGSNGPERYLQQAQQYHAQNNAYLNSIQEIRAIQKSLEAQGRQNKEVMRADLYNFINTQHSAARLAMHDAVQRRVAARNSLYVKRSGVQELAMHTADAAAAGTIGASVNAVAHDIRKRSDSALAEVQANREIERDNYYQSVADLYTGYYQNQQIIDDTLPDMPQPPNTRVVVNTSKQSIGSILLGSALNVGMDYLSSQVKLGLGSKPAPAPTQGHSVQLYGLRL